MPAEPHLTSPQVRLTTHVADVATNHMIPSNRPGELARMLLELT